MVHWRPQVDHGHPQERGEAYIVPAGGGGKVMRSPGKKVLLYAGYFLLLFCMWGGPFCYVFLFVGAARALTPVQMFVGGGGVGKPKKDHHRNIKGPPPPPTIKKVAEKAPTWRKSR